MLYNALQEYNIVWDEMIELSMVIYYYAIQCYIIPYDKLQCNTIEYNTTQYKNM